MDPNLYDQLDSIHAHSRLQAASASEGGAQNGTTQQDRTARPSGVITDAFRLADLYTQQSNLPQGLPPLTAQILATAAANGTDFDNAHQPAHTPLLQSTENGSSTPCYGSMTSETAATAVHYSQDDAESLPGGVSLVCNDADEDRAAIDMSGSKIFTLASAAAEAICSSACIDHANGQLQALQLIVDFKNGAVRIGKFSQSTADCYHNAGRYNAAAPDHPDAITEVIDHYSYKPITPAHHQLSIAKFCCITNQYQRWHVQQDLKRFDKEGITIQRGSTNHEADVLKDSIHKLKSALHAFAYHYDTHRDGYGPSSVDRAWLHFRKKEYSTALPNTELMYPGTPCPIQMAGMFVVAKPISDMQIRRLCRSLLFSEMSRREMVEHLAWLESLWTD